MEALREPGPGFGTGKKQGRGPSMPPPALPAPAFPTPDIETGLRQPVNYRLPRESTGKCDPFHIRRKKSCGKPVVAPVRRHSVGGAFWQLFNRLSRTSVERG